MIVDVYSSADITIGSAILIMMIITAVAVTVTVIIVALDFTMQA